MTEKGVTNSTEVFTGSFQARSFFPVLGIMAVFKVQTWEMDDVSCIGQTN